MTNGILGIKADIYGSKNYSETEKINCLEYYKLP